MASTVDELLSRALLRDAPPPPADIADTAPAPRTASADDSGGGAHRPAGSPPAPAGAAERQAAMRAAAHDLRALCEAAVSGAAVTALGGDFLTQSLPQPGGARVLGCILLLADTEDSARFWWQYAAGAGDAIASYCLYLHHLALGENRQASWWHGQTAPAAEAAALPTALRVLRALRPGGPGPGPGRAAVDAVLEYVPAAVNYVDDDLELPLPDPDFSERIRALTAAPRRRP
ncbi:MULTISPECIES: hypothetical protein [Streptomyces]|uniref:hypothetical protein n=1 Tax=Streptomyces TaxID=1883 RepID=UPI0016780366|nr:MULTISPECIES: hypothetical protein [Streptomyces]MBD3576977.1 hypothetical protein [Streptomyces sp. KD18]GGT04751.1 hypothetical protein GCM10010286_32390 [Streptomyces toxytricini]